MIKEAAEFSVGLFTDKYPGVSNYLDIENSAYIKKEGGQTIYLQKDNYFDPLIEKIEMSALDIARKYYQIIDGYQPEVVSMWLNTHTKNNVHPPHNHQNTFLSGVFYLSESPKIASIGFLRPYAIPFLPIIKEYNKYNTTVIKHVPSKDDVIFFPSYVYHYVDLNTEDKPRMSIAFDIILRGEYGEITKNNGTVGQFKI
jgi:uncharacterized protein (TIGR02466 family)|tara:strand:- start:7258 stop:7854 length:597 start_codon:yes stop_codon:yes gene_type:complete